MKFHIEVIYGNRFCYLNAISDETNERIGKLSIDLRSEDANRYQFNYRNAVKIILVMTNLSYCRRGVASALLNKAVELFKNDIIYLNVVPLPRNSRDKDKTALINFYSKFGFKRYEKDICVTTMIRK